MTGLGVTAFSVGGSPPAPGPRITPPVGMYSVEHAITTGQIPVGGTAVVPVPAAHRLVAASVNPPMTRHAGPLGPPGHLAAMAALLLPCLLVTACSRAAIPAAGSGELVPVRRVRAAWPQAGPPRDGGPGLQLLQQAAQAGARVSYQGVEMVSAWGATGDTTVIANVWHHSGGDTLVQAADRAGTVSQGRQAERVRRHRQPGPRGRARGHRAAGRAAGGPLRPGLPGPGFGGQQARAGGRGAARGRLAGGAVLAGPGDQAAAAPGGLRLRRAPGQRGRIHRPQGRCAAANAGPAGPAAPAQRRARHAAHRPST